MKHRHWSKHPARFPELLSLQHKAKNPSGAPQSSLAGFQLLLDPPSETAMWRSCLNRWLLQGIPKPGLDVLLCMTGPSGRHRHLIFNVRNPGRQSCAEQDCMLGHLGSLGFLCQPLRLCQISFPRCQVLAICPAKCEFFSYLLSNIPHSVFDTRKKNVWSNGQPVGYQAWEQRPVYLQCKYLTSSCFTEAEKSMFKTYRK